MCHETSALVPVVAIPARVDMASEVINLIRMLIRGRFFWGGFVASMVLIVFLKGVEERTHLPRTGKHGAKQTRRCWCSQNRRPHVRRLLRSSKLSTLQR